MSSILNPHEEAGPGVEDRRVVLNPAVPDLQHAYQPQGRAFR